MIITVLHGQGIRHPGHQGGEMGEFRAELEILINRHSLENGSDTPDFILAEYLTDCLKAFDKAMTRRAVWYGERVEDDK